MKLLNLLIICSVFFTGCRLKEAMDDNFQSKSTIEPFAPSKSLAERYGDGEKNTFILKIPLTESSIGYFDIDEVLGNDSADRHEQNFLSRVANGFTHALFNVALRLGIKNKMKISSFFELPNIPKKYIHSARVTKVFFTTEDCRPEEKDCDDIRSSEGNFNFVDKFFVNLAVDDMPPPMSAAELEEEEFAEEVSGGEFQSAVEKAFNETEESASSTILSMVNSPELSKAQGKDVNILKFENQVPFMALDTSRISDEERSLTFNVNDSKKARLIADYFATDNFQENYLADVDKDGKEVHVRLKSHITPSQFFAQISADQSPLAQKMFIFRLENNYRQAKQYFNKEKFKHLIKDTTMIGRSLFVELKSAYQKEEFLSLIDEEGDSAEDHFSIYRREVCNLSNCLDLQALPVNMGPLLSSGKDVRVDTWFSIRSIGSRDFKYNGYIEVEIIIENLGI